LYLLRSTSEGSWTREDVATYPETFLRANRRKRMTAPSAIICVVSRPNFIYYCPRELWSASDRKVFWGAPWAIKSSAVGYWDSVLTGAARKYIDLEKHTRRTMRMMAGTMYFI
jgi:hypothetical protein